jgi:hypothetical protein
MYDMIPLTEAARRAESGELSANENIPQPFDLTAAAVECQGRGSWP